jgi:OOP family OmpA-OmpF porin
MNKFLATAIAAALAAASTASFADTINGGFFINGNLGQSNYRVSKQDWTDRNDFAEAVRFGYTWYNTVDFGVEAGYVNLGELGYKVKGGGYYFKDAIEGRGLLLGVNGKYRFAGKWYVSARGGWMRSHATERLSSNYPGLPGFGGSESFSSNDNGWYAGAGVGYDFTPNFSLGVNYDNYHSKATFGDFDASANVAMYSAFAEYRF